MLLNQTDRMQKITLISFFYNRIIVGMDRPLLLYINKKEPSSAIQVPGCYTISDSDFSMTKQYKWVIHLRLRQTQN